jgi:hypothetical protein
MLPGYIRLNVQSSLGPIPLGLRQRSQAIGPVRLPLIAFAYWCFPLSGTGSTLDVSFQEILTI